LFSLATTLKNEVVVTSVIILATVAGKVLDDRCLAIERLRAGIETTKARVSGGGRMGSIARGTRNIGNCRAEPGTGRAAITRHNWDGSFGWGKTSLWEVRRWT
jgi:hypothetical protein